MQSPNTVIDFHSAWCTMLYFPPHLLRPIGGVLALPAHCVLLLDYTPPPKDGVVPKEMEYGALMIDDLHTILMILQLHMSKYAISTMRKKHPKVVVKQQECP